MKNLPKKIFLDDVKESLETSYNKKQDSLQNATAKIAELRNLKIETVEQLESISPEWLENEINKSKQNLSTIFGTSGGFIPSGISKQFSDEYERVRRECKDPIETITGHLLWCKDKGIGIKIDSKGRPWFNEKDVKESVEREATHCFSETEIEYYQHFQAIFEAMDGLRSYESENGFEMSDLQTVMRDRFASCFSVDMNTLKTNRRSYQFTPEEYYKLIGYGRICRKGIKNEDDISATI